MTNLSCVSLFVVVVVASIVPLKGSDFKFAQAVTRIVFGSCNKDDRPQPLWDPIAAFKPDVFIWLGDVIYGDTLKFPLRITPNSAEYIRAKFERQKLLPAYQQIVSSTHVIGTWDDHDFGLNNAGRDWALKEQTRQMFLDFVDEPPAGPRRSRDGVYGAYEFGVPGKKVKVILLDARYNRDDPSVESGDMLGEAQWRWLESELASNDAQVLLLGSGTQVLPPDKTIQEKWSVFPASRQRLFDLLARYNPPNLVILSGDIHYGEFSRLNCPSNRSVLEVTSSGLTHSCRSRFAGLCDFILHHNELSRYHVGEFADDLNFGAILIDWLVPFVCFVVWYRASVAAGVRLATRVLMRRTHGCVRARWGVHPEYSPWKTKSPFIQISRSKLDTRTRPLVLRPTTPCNRTSARS
eukprot:TRINITY_DN24274_c0_g1_i1.p1 TRINITY_DN24274_c0_g1~~TRINITY_DN24274_c0_g1_i1.p1  ORF type:complete len:408 (-),score=71.52 TRINITY_DN24274_c0_g1_i1:20-1243(-)